MEKLKYTPKNANRIVFMIKKSNGDTGGNGIQSNR